MWSTVADWIAKKNTDILLQDGGFERWVVPTWPTNTGFRKIPWKLVSNLTLIAKRDLFKGFLPATRIVPWLIPKTASCGLALATIPDDNLLNCIHKVSRCSNVVQRHLDAGMIDYNISIHHICIYFYMHWYIHNIFIYLYMHWHIDINRLVIHICNVNSCCPIFTLTGSWFRILRIIWEQDRDKTYQTVQVNIAEPAYEGLYFPRILTTLSVCQITLATLIEQRQPSPKWTDMFFFFSIL